MPLLVRDCLQGAPVTAEAELPVAELIALLNRHRLSGVPVVDAGGMLQGIVTIADVHAHLDIQERAQLTAIALDPPDLDRVPVSQIMSRRVLTIAAESNALNALESMIEHKVRRLVVLQDGKVAGVVVASAVITRLRALIG